MRRPFSAILASIVLVLLAPSIASGAARDQGDVPLAPRLGFNAADGVVRTSTSPPRFKLPSAVGLKVRVGYSDQFRSSAWVPVRIALHNYASAQLAGTVTIHDAGNDGQYSNPSFSSVYTEPVVLPASSTKHVTLYVPGQDINNVVNVQFTVGRQIIARASDSPTSAGDSTITVGALSGDPQVSTWIRHADTSAGPVDVIPLTPAILDPVAEALATFDAIVLTNIDSAQLTHDQLAALEQYVRTGGSLLLVGGPDWQETLRPLPTSLVPGTLVGSARMSNLAGVDSIGVRGIPRGVTVVSHLTHPRGFVLAQQAGIPLIVRGHLGSGRVMYVAFDPAIDPIATWSRTDTLATVLIQQVTPQVMYRLSASGFQSSNSRGRISTSIIRQELANVPGATRPTLLLLVLLTLLSVVILGPLNFLLFRRLRRPELGWIVLPVLAVVLLVGSVKTALHFKGNLVLLNTVGVVQLDGSTANHPAALYVGLFSSVRGAYHMVWNGRALPQALPQYSFDGTPPTGTSPIGVNLSEGSSTAVDFPAMNMWSTRSVALQTTVNIAGAVRGNLHLAPDGSIVGTIRNDTDLALMAPAILAGNTVRRLTELRPHATQTVRIQPSADIQDPSLTMLWDQIYGTSTTSGDFNSWDGDPWEAPNPGTETSLVDRLRNVGDRLPGGEILPVTNGVVLVGWSEQALGSLTVDGTSPRRRDLNLIEVPLSVKFSPGAFRLRQGTLSPYLVGGYAQSPQGGCCPSSLGSQVVGVGAGGSAIFQFDIPNPAHVHFHRLILSVNAGGVDGSKVAQVYDWRSHRWVHVNLQPINAVLATPSRFISAEGALQIRLHATTNTGDIVISDPEQDVQLSGTGTVG